MAKRMYPKNVDYMSIESLQTIEEKEKLIEFINKNINYSIDFEVDYDGPEAFVSNVVAYEMIEETDQEHIKSLENSIKQTKYNLDYYQKELEEFNKANHES